MTKEADIALVIPAYREELRLPRYLPDLVAELAEAPFQTLIQIVDDGSPPLSYEALAAATPPEKKGNCTILPLLRLSANCGKGGAILAGWSHVPRVEWMAFVDADGAIPSDCVRKLLEAAIQGGSQYCVIGTRLSLKQVKRSFLRNLIGISFRRVTAFILGRSAQDTQCGLKAIPHAVLNALHPLISERGFAFDVNLLLAAEALNLKVKEVPVAFHDVGGGQINPLKDGFRMLCSVLRLRRAKTQWKNKLPAETLVHS